MIKMIFGFALITGGLILSQYIPHYMFDMDMRYFIGIGVCGIMWMISGRRD